MNKTNEIELCVVCGGTGFLEDICDGMIIELFCECSEGVKRMNESNEQYQQGEDYE